MLNELLTPENLIALVTLTGLEIVLGIDNIIFLSILTSKLPEAQRPKARFIGLALAMGARIGLLLCITWVMGLTKPLFIMLGQPISGQALILIIGGFFLIGKSTHEIHSKLEHVEDSHAGGPGGKPVSFGLIIFQIILIDLVFSLDSVITAVGMVNPGAAAVAGHAVAEGAAAHPAVSGSNAAKLTIMITAVMISVAVMMLFAGKIGAFVERHPTIKILALSFLILIGVMLVAEGFGQHVSKGYIYVAMAFSLVVEMLNIRLRKKSVPMVGGITGRSLPGTTPPTT